VRTVTFDSVPWVITLKKNDHYFPMVEWIKDPSDACGWKRITYEGGKAAEERGETTTGLELGAMDTAEDD